MADALEKNIQNIDELRQQVEKLRDALVALQEDFNLDSSQFSSVITLMNNLDKASDIIDDFAYKADNIDKIDKSFKELNNDVVNSAAVLNRVTDTINNIVSEVGSSDLVNKLNISSALVGTSEGLEEQFENQRLAIFNIVSSIDNWIDKTAELDSSVSDSMKNSKSAILDTLEIYKNQGDIESYKQNILSLSELLVNIKEQYKEVYDAQKLAERAEKQSRYDDTVSSGGYQGILANAKENENYNIEKFQIDTLNSILDELDNIKKKYVDTGKIGQDTFEKVSSQASNLHTAMIFSEKSIDDVAVALNKLNTAMNELRVEAIGVEFKPVVDKKAVDSLIEGNTDFKIDAGVDIDFDREDLQDIRDELSKGFEEVKVEPKIDLKKTVDSVKNAFDIIGKIVDNVRKVFDAIINTINKLVKIAIAGFKAIKTAIEGVIDTGKTVLELFGNLANRVRNIADNINPIESLKNAFKDLTDTIANGIENLGNFGKSIENIFNNSVTSRANELFTSVYSLVNIVGKEEADNVINWAKNLEYAFGLSSAGLITNLNKLTGVMYGVGIAAKDVGTASKNFSFLSEYFVGQGLVKDSATAINAFTSAMRGSSRAVSQLGIAMSDNALDAYLVKLKETGKISKEVTSDFTKLSNEAKAYVRYSYLVSQAAEKYDLSNYANNINTVTGRMHALNNALLTLRHTIGTGLYKALASIAPLITSILKLIDAAVVHIFDLFNIDVSISSDMNEGAGAVSNIGDAAEESADKLKDIEEAANKAKGSVLGFDKVTSLYTDDKSNGSGLDNLTDFDYSGLIDGDLFDISDIKKQEEDIFDRLKKKTEEFEKWAVKRTGRLNYSLEFDWDRIKKNLEKIHDNIKKTIENWKDFIITIGLKILDDINIGKIVTEFTEFIRAASELARVISEVLTPALDIFYENGLRPIVEWIGDKLADALIFATRELDKWSIWFLENKDTIYNFFKALGEIVATVWSVFQPYFDAAWDWLKTKIEGLGEGLRKALEYIMGDTIKNEDTIIDKIETWPGRIDHVVNQIKKAFRSLISGEFTLDDQIEANIAIDKLKSGEDLNIDDVFAIVIKVLKDINTILSSILAIVKDIGQEFLNWVKTEGLPWLIEKLGELGEWLDKHKKQIEQLIETLAKTAWDAFQKFVDIIGKLVNYAVEHPDDVANFLKAIVAVKLLSWASGLIGPLTTVVGLLMSLAGLTVPKWLALLSGNVGLNVAAFTGAGAAGAGAAGATGASIAAGTGAGTAVGSAGALGLAGVFAAGAGVSLYKIHELDKIWGDAEAMLKYKYELLASQYKDMGDSVVNSAKALEDLNYIIQQGTLPVIEETKQLKDTSDNTKQQTLELIESIKNGYDSLVDSIKSGTYEGLSNTEPQMLQAIIEGIEKQKEGMTNLYDGVSSLTESEVDTNLENLSATIQKNVIDANNTLAGQSEYYASIVNGDTESSKEILSKYVDESINSSVISLDELLDEHNKNIKESVGPGKEKLSQSAKKNVDEEVVTLDDLINKYSKDLKTEADKKKQGFLSKLGETLSGIGNAVVNFVKDITKDIGTNTKTGNTKVNIPTNNKQRIAQNPIYTHASGGSIPGGQLFIANENGPELVGNITNKPGVDVANNNMITEAIRQASRQGIIEGLRTTSSNTGTEKVINIKFEGGTLITPDALRAFAREIAPLINGANINFANSGFSI